MHLGEGIGIKQEGRHIGRGIGSAGWVQCDRWHIGGPVALGLSWMDGNLLGALEFSRTGGTLVGALADLST